MSATTAASSCTRELSKSCGMGQPPLRSALPHARLGSANRDSFASERLHCVRFGKLAAPGDPRAARSHARVVPLGLFAGLLIVQVLAAASGRSSSSETSIRRAPCRSRSTSMSRARGPHSRRSRRQICWTCPTARAFNEVALRLVPTQPGWYAVLLVHPSGAVIADTALARDDMPSFTTAAGCSRSSTTKRPAVSNLFQDAAYRRPLLRRRRSGDALGRSAVRARGADPLRRA